MSFSCVSNILSWIVIPKGNIKFKVRIKLNHSNNTNILPWVHYYNLHKYVIPVSDQSVVFNYHISFTVFLPKRLGNHSGPIKILHASLVSPY